MSEELDAPRNPAVAPATAPTRKTADSNGRLPFWILISVIVGFMLPVCSCGVIGTTSFMSMIWLGSSTPTTGLETGDAVAIVRVEGVIESGAADQFSTTSAISGVVIADLEAAVADDDVKAIVLRVDSPGGTVTGSSQIHEALLGIEKPVVVSMGAMAASGGYMVSAPADYIFARPDTFTGSIGVIMTVFNVEELAEKLGVKVTSLTSGDNKAMGSYWEAMSPEQEAILTALIDESYADFVAVIVDGRGLSEEEVRQLADGRIYSGRQAVDNGLADELGDLDAAIRKAADLGGISGDPRIIEYDHEPSFEQLLSDFSFRASQSEADRITETLNELSAPTLEYRYVGP